MTDRLDDLKRLAPDPGINTPVNWAIDEIERLRALVRELRDALGPITKDAEDFNGWLGGCDHDVGICYCEMARNIERARAAIEKAKEPKP